MAKSGSRRAKPVTTKAGFTTSKRRYGCGGKMKTPKKKS